MRRTIYSSVETGRSFKVKINEINRDLFSSFQSGYRLYLRDYSSKKNNSSLLLLWDFLEPVVLSLVFIILHKYRVLNTDGLSMPYALFVVTGILQWQSYTDSLQEPLHLINKYKILLNSTNVSPCVILMAGFIGVFHSAKYKLLVILAAVIFYNDYNFFNILVFSFWFFWLLIAFYMVGAILAPFNYINNDVSRVIGLLLRPLMFLSGIIIPMQSLGLLSEYNYIATFVEAGRSILIASLDFSLTIIEMPIIFIMSVIVFLIGVYVFHSSVKVVLGN